MKYVIRHTKKRLYANGNVWGPRDTATFFQTAGEAFEFMAKYGVYAVVEFLPS